MSENKAMVKIEFDRVGGMSDGAVLLEIDNESFWIPHSQIHASCGMAFGDEDVWVIIPEWLAVAKGLESYGEAV